MTIDQLLAVLVVVTFVNVALVIVVWRGGPFTERRRSRSTRERPDVSVAPSLAFAEFASHLGQESGAPTARGDQPVVAASEASDVAGFATPPTTETTETTEAAVDGTHPPASPAPPEPQGDERTKASGDPSASIAGSATSGADRYLPPDPTSRRFDSLPTDLAELLTRPAAIGPDESGPVRTPAPVHDGFRPILAWLPHLNRQTSETGLPLDPLTSLEGPASWSRILEIENARLLRYRRPVTIVMAELEGVHRLAERVGQEAVDRLLPVVADAFRKEARGSDWIARIGEARFAALMSETDEIQAINYVERVRLCCEPWLGSAAVPMRLAIGWASPSASGDLEFAVGRAEERMHADRRGAGKGLVPVRNAGPRVVSLPARPANDLADEPDADGSAAEAAAYASDVERGRAQTEESGAGPQKPRHRKPERGA